MAVGRTIDGVANKNLRKRPSHLRKNTTSARVAGSIDDLLASDEIDTGISPTTSGCTHVICAKHFRAEA